MAGKFDAIFIDFYGTICAGDWAAVADACARIVESLNLPLTPDQLARRWGERFFAVIDQSNDGNFRTLQQCERVSLSETVAQWVSAFDPGPLIESIEAYWRDPELHPEVLDVLAGIDLPICCVSNADAGPLEAAINKHALRFDGVVSSEAVRHYKPHPEIFRRACARLGVTPDRVVHVGDSLHSDIEGAQKLDMTTVWVCRRNRIHDIGTCAADHTIATLAELPALLE